MNHILRAHPNMFVFRPADGNETVGAYVQAIENPLTPSVLCLSRQGTPTLAGSSAEKTALGGYIVAEFEKGQAVPASSTCDLVIVASGSEVSLATGVASALQELNVRYVTFSIFSF